MSSGHQLVMKFPAFYGTRSFNTAFTAARHLSLSWARSIYSMSPLHFLNTYILSSHLCFGSPLCSLSFRFPSTTLHEPLLLPHVPLALSVSSLRFVTLWFDTVWFELAYLLTPWCRILLEKLTGLQLVKKFPAFHGTRRSITALTSLRHLSLSWASPIQSIYPHPTSWRSILILSTHLRLGLPSGLLPSGFYAVGNTMGRFRALNVHILDCTLYYCYTL